MKTRAAAATLDMVKLDPASGVPLYRQLGEAVRNAILNGRLAPGVRLPATRVVMKELGVSRNTVLAAFDQLTTNGYVVSKPGSGANVASTIPGDPTLPVPSPAPSTLAPPPLPVGLAPATPLAKNPAPLISPRPESLTTSSLVPTNQDRTPKQPSRAAVLAELPLSKLYRPGPPKPFRPSTPDWREFPLELWERLRTRVLRENASQLLNPGDPAGYLPLREALAAYLREARDVRCTAAQIVVTAGAQQALRLIACVLTVPGDVVAIEEPGYFGAKAAFLDAGARLSPLLVDDEGPITPGARRHNPSVLVYVTPAHQFPLGVTMTLPRRLGMLDFAAENKAWVIEDDYDTVFRYEGVSPDSLLSLDSHGRVIYIGNTSQVLSPALRIGYLVLPSAQVDSFVKASAIAAAAPSLVDQAALSLLISEGHLARHVRHVKQLYQGRLSMLRQIVQRDLPGVFEFEALSAGLNTVAWLRRGWDEEEIASASLAAGLELTPLGAYGTTALMRPGVLFGFSAFNPEELQKAVSRLMLALRSKRAPRFSTAAPSSA